MRARVLNGISDIPDRVWNTLVSRDYPFLRHEFLLALERHGAATARTGWQPHHLLLEDEAGLQAAAPLYLKSHSYGEFVFDFSWAEASQRLGRAYYPKLLNAVPFNPVTGPRLLARTPSARAALAQAVRKQAETLGLSSAHALFLDANDRAAYTEAGFLLRKDCHYQWFNPGYRDFEDYLDALPGRRRKEIRRERRKVAETGIRFEVLTGAEVPESLWPAIYRCYANTYRLRGQPPYLSLECLKAIGIQLGREVRMFLAWRGNTLIAAAYMLEAGDTLYGRHWGCVEDIPGLHFETCYYRGIEHCIGRRLARFDAGAQGEHKLHRGFAPVATWSAHWLAEARLRAAVADFLRRETAAVDAYIRQVAGKYPAATSSGLSTPRPRGSSQTNASPAGFPLAHE
ncbi:MAG TPA: GNAT family N-acetyltransferase [Nevskiales bacterium]|nr:GNAT family N-acetyltransferase [Nevskiales bacterium]